GKRRSRPALIRASSSLAASLMLLCTISDLINAPRPFPSRAKEHVMGGRPWNTSKESTASPAGKLTFVRDLRAASRGRAGRGSDSPCAVMSASSCAAGGRLACGTLTRISAADTGDGRPRKPGSFFRKQTLFKGKPCAPRRVLVGPRGRDGV